METDGRAPCTSRATPTRTTFEHEGNPLRAVYVTTRHLPPCRTRLRRRGSTPGNPTPPHGCLNAYHGGAAVPTRIGPSPTRSGPLAQFLAIPQDSGNGEEKDPLKLLKADLRTT